MTDESRTAETPLERGPLKFWFAQGLVVYCADGARDAGVLEPWELLEFAEYAMKHYPNEKVLVTSSGLRVTRYEGQMNGPGLDWRDWT